MSATVVLACVGLTAMRSHDYRSARAIWEDTVRKWPGQMRSLNNLAVALAEDAVRAGKAVAVMQEALRHAQPADLSSALVVSGS